MTNQTPKVGSRNPELRGRNINWGLFRPYGCVKASVSSILSFYNTYCAHQANTSWQNTVYAPRQGLSKAEMEAWISKVSQVCKTKQCRCQACWEIFPEGQLRLHHVIPRDYSGTEDDDNLILLCIKCHNYIEPLWKEYNTRRKITKSRVKSNAPIKIKPLPPINDWRKWVYGGYRRSDSQEPL